jgi:hypothetical protein
MDLDLVPHPAMPPGAVSAVRVLLDREPRELRIEYLVLCDPARIRLPAPQRPYRAEGLWETTCFELFLRAAGEGYCEFNFSPSSQWAAYSFRAYREGREKLEANDPPTARLLSPEHNAIMLLASVPVAPAVQAMLGVSAVIEETDGTRSYWALAHPPGDKPDFHDPACFALELPAA